MQTQAALDAMPAQHGVIRNGAIGGAVERSPALRPLLGYATTALPTEAQFEAWRRHCAPVVEMVEPLAGGPGYAARSTIWKLGPFALSAVAAPAARYRRTATQIRRDALDHWVISLARRGTHVMQVAGSDAASTAPAGLPYVFSLADAFEGERSDIDWVCLFVPREAFPELALTIDGSRHQALDSGMGQLLAGILGTLDTRLAAMTEAELPRLVAALRAVIAACVAPSAEAQAGALQLDLARRERVRQAIRRNLRSPTLTPQRICRLVGMSRSQLYRLFESSGGVVRYIQTERLREAHRALSDPDTRRDIHEVAEDLGFFDASTFSRIFRRVYGCAPSEVRAAAVAGAAAGPVTRAPTAGPATDLASILRLL